MIYFDNTATSWPKPDEVITSMSDFLTFTGANPGRAGHHMAVEAGRIVYNTREALADFFNAEGAERVVFTQNITEALNICIHGILEPGDHVITSGMEHNSVIRPLRTLEKQGMELSIAHCSVSGILEPDEITKLIKKNTKLIVINHASNVTGTILPIKEIGKICREYDLLFLVDTAQTAGCYPINMEIDNIDFLSFTGHKTLYGPMGTGGLIIGHRVDAYKLKTIKQGGTGSHSEFEEQPDFLPDALESGTLNAIGISGLHAGIKWIKKTGINTIKFQKEALTRELINGLKNIKTVTVYGTQNATKQTSTVSFNIGNMAPSEVGFRLDEDYKILCRVGLHCAPLAHKTIGTFPGGTVRFGLGAFNTAKEVQEAVDAVSEIAKDL